MVRERIEKVRFERTQTMQLKKDLNAKAFKDMIEPGKEGQDEKMAQIAAKMQKKFLSDEEDIKKGNKRVRYIQMKFLNRYLWGTFSEATKPCVYWSVVAERSSAPDSSSGVVRKPECGFDSR